MNTGHCCRSAGRRALFASFAVFLLAFCAASVPAWMPPSGEGKIARIDRWPPDSFHWSPHVYIIEHAIRMLASDGYENWADLAAQHLQDLANGARYADKAGQEIYLTWKVDILWFWTVYEDRMYLANSASLDHFYNPNEPNTHLGLDLQGWNALEKAGNWGKAISLLVTCLAGIPGLADASGDVSPDFPNRGRSAIDLCQEKYDSGVAAARNGNYSDAMFNLGWAGHCVGDLSVVQHTYDSWITHEKYEEAADNKGNDPRFHAATARPWSSPALKCPEDLYQMVRGGVTASQLALATAKYVHSLEQFKWAEGANATPGGVANEIGRWAADNGGPADFDQALARALPVAERHTAALIARFMTDTGVPEKVPPVVGSVRDTNNNPVPGAYVFYCSRADSNSYPTQWEYIRADDSGRFAFNIRPQRQYLIHPAMPGYTYKLKGRYVYNLVSGTQVQNLGPDSSAWFTQQGGKVSNQIELVLDSLPKTVQIGGASARRPSAASASTAVRTGAPLSGPKPGSVQVTELAQFSSIPSLGNLRARLNTEQAGAAAKPKPVIAPGTLLPASKSCISATMADYLNETMLQVRAVRRGLQYNALGQPLAGDPLTDRRLTVVVPMSDRDAERPYVVLQVNHLVGFAKGGVLTTAQEIAKTIDLARSSARPQAANLTGGAVQANAGSAPAARTGRPSASTGRLETGRVRGIERPGHRSVPTALRAGRSRRWLPVCRRKRRCWPTAGRRKWLRRHLELPAIPPGRP